MKSGSIFLPCLLLLLITITPLDAFGLKCEKQRCVITELRSPKETFLYRYFPDDVTDVVYTQLMVRHVNGDILEGIGAGLEKNVNINASPRVQSVSLSSKCNIFFLTIDRTGLREIEFEENDKLREVIINNSRLKSVTSTFRLLKNLYKVYIEQSLIQHVDLGIFCSHMNLVLVDFSDNKLRSIGNSNRETCTMQNASIVVTANFIKYLNLELFEIFGNNSVLAFGENQIETLPLQFSSETLKKFDLHDNRLHSLNICKWNTPILDTLNLGSNLLTSLPECLENLKNLKLLFLSSNRITSINIESFATMWSLTDLVLRENNMTSIVLNSTRFPPHLKALHLSTNLLTSLNLSSIPVQDFQVNVPHNSIASFDVNGTSPNVTELFMSCNPIDCSWNSAKEKESAICTRDHEVVYNREYKTYEIVRYSFLKRDCE